MGKLWGIIQEHIDASPYPPSERQVAKRLGVSPTALSNWKSPKNLPGIENLRAIALLTSVPYERVLAAALEDTGYVSVLDARAGSGKSPTAIGLAAVPPIDYDALHDALDRGDMDDVPFAAGSVHEEDGVEQQGGWGAGEGSQDSGSDDPA